MRKTLYNIVIEIEKKYNVSLSEDKLGLIDLVIPLLLEEKVTFVKFYKAVVEMAEHQKGLIEFNETVNALQLVGIVAHNSKEQM